MDTRARFEEIWPVPDGLRWESDYMKGNDYYAPDTEHGASEEHWIKAGEWSARLDTFTRCQETTDVYVSLVKDMLAEIDRLAEDAYGCVPQPTQDIVDRANALIGVKNGY